MAHPRYVGLRLSTTAGAVPTAADIDEGELAINTADGRVYTLAGSTIIDLTDRYSVSEIDSLLDGKADVSSLAAVAASGAYGDLTGRPTLGTAAPLDVPASGDAAAGEVVKGDDSRLSDARAPTAHTHPWSDVGSKPDTATRWPTFAEVTSKPATYPPTAHNHSLVEITDAGTAAAEDASAFDAAGTASAAVSNHESASDPHSQYVQKSPGKGLSTEDYTTADRDKLAGIEAGATADQTKADIDALGIDADTVDGKHADDFDPAGSAAAAEQRIRETLRQTPDPLLMHFL